MTQILPIPPINYNAKAYGATGNGTTDDTAALQAAINAAQAAGSMQGDNLAMLVPTVFVPFGNYKVTSLHIASQAGLRIMGDWGSRIFSSGSSLFDLQNNYIEGLELDHLSLEATGGHIFTNANLKWCWFHHLYLTQNSSNFSVWDQQQASNQLQNCHFSDIKCWVYPDPVTNARSAPGWNIVCPTGDAFAECYWDRVAFQGAANANGHFDQTQYMFRGACSGSGYASTLKFRDCTSHRSYGGVVHLSSVSHAVFDTFAVYDVFTLGNGDTVGASSFLVDTYPAGTPSLGIEFRSCTRSQALGGGSPGTYSDIEVSSDTDEIYIHGHTQTNFHRANNLQFNLHGAADVVIVGSDTPISILNPGADTLIIENGDITLGGASLIMNNPRATDANFVAWNGDPGMIGGSGTAVTAGTVYLQAVYVRKKTNVSKLWYYVTSAGSGATAGQNFVGLYNSSGTLLASAGIDSNLTSGTQSISISSTAVTPGLYWIGFVINATGLPSLLRGTSDTNQGNMGLSASTFRFCVNGTLQTSLSNITPGSNSSTGAHSYWVGMS